MSEPRQILPNTIYLLTRRCLQRQYLLRPCQEVNQILLFCLAYAAQSFGIRLHAFCAMSNHYHVVVTDVHGNLPQFMQWLNEYTAKCINAHLGRWETFWAPGSYSAARLLERNDVVAKMVYTYTNPVDAGLVRTAREWPGAISFPEDLTKPPVRVDRPQVFFRDDGLMPDHALLQFDVPDALREDGLDPVELLEQAVAAKEQEIQRAMQAAGRRFLGRRAVLAQSPFGRPGDPEPRRGLRPRVAAIDKWRRIEALQRLKSFIQAYREARRRFAQGDRSVLFPWGTYWMRVHLGVQCSGP